MSTKARASLRERLKSRINNRNASGSEGTTASGLQRHAASSGPSAHAGHVDQIVEKALLRFLSDPKLVFPINTDAMLRKIQRNERNNPSSPFLGSKEQLVPKVTGLLNKFMEEGFVTLEKDAVFGVAVAATNCSKLVDMHPDLATATSSSSSSSSSSSAETNKASDGPGNDEQRPAKMQKTEKFASNSSSSGPSSSSSSSSSNMTDVEALLSTRSCKQRELTKIGAELEALLNRPSQKEVQDKQQFKSKGGKSAVKEFCPHGTREQCRAERMLYYACEKVHFRKLLQAHTDESLGDCSYLNACRHMHTCKFVHYDIDPEQDEQPFQSRKPRHALRLTQASKEDTEWNDNDYAQKYGAQWINTDIRKFKYPLLGHFSVIMADPPWHIHMDLPYGTMSDEEMLGMRMAELQNDGVMLLWVTGRAMELGRDCLEHWGYECAGEILWVKTNQLQRLIRTGRTGHWLNHSKEHCLIGIKGDPKIHHNIDCDVIVAEVRETSRKPDEIYNILERLSPGTRKLEIFGRPHNTRPGWITLGNQVDGTKLTDPGIIQRFRSEYPDVEINTVKSKGGLDPTVANKPPPPPPPQANYPHNHKPKSTVVAVSTGDKTVVPLSRTKNNAQATTNVIISSLVPKS